MFFLWLNPVTFYRFATKLSLKVCTLSNYVVTIIFQQKEMYPIKVTKSISEAAELLFLFVLFFNWNEFGRETVQSDRVESHIHEEKNFLF
jgi:hypothetical protein